MNGDPSAFMPLQVPTAPGGDLLFGYYFFNILID